MFKFSFVLAILMATSVSLGACTQNPTIRVQSVDDNRLSVGKVDSSNASNSGGEEKDCKLAQAENRIFLPQTSDPPSDRILPPTDNECAFYNWAVQSYLFATQPLGSSKLPRFLTFESVESVFNLKSTPPETNGKHLPVLNAGFRQAGSKSAILVDQNHNPVFYSIYINSIYAKFVREQGLNQLDNLLGAPEAGGLPGDLEFPPGSLELKAAWKVIEPGEDHGDYFTMLARVPVLEERDGKVVESGQTRVAMVAMLALHVVGVIEDHPEFIWSTFEHVNAEGQRDLSPAAEANPDEGSQSLQATLAHYPLFQPGTPLEQANQIPSELSFDAASQKFTPATSVFRVFPASQDTESEEDHEVLTLNQDLRDLFDQTDPQKQDLRRHYHLVGAVWLDEPGANQADGIFKANHSFDNTAQETILAGEDALSNMALESFTQGSQLNCMSCHNTLSKSLPEGITLPPRRINVSNVLTFYASRAAQAQQVP